MNFILSFELSLKTLLAVSCLPLVFFIVQSKYRYRPDLQSRGSFFLLALSILAIVGLGIKTLGEHDPEVLLLALAHLAPLLTTVLIAMFSRAPKIRPLPGSAKSYEDYAPVPLNSEVERLSWNDLVIGDHLREELLTVIHILKDPKSAKKYGIEVPKGILLAGPPGTGKTTIAKAIANSAGLSFFALKMDEIVSKWVGESEKNLSKLFNAALRSGPSVIFIDEVDSIGKKRGGGANQQWAENLLNHLLQLIDGVIRTEGLYIIAATNRPDLVDDALKRSGRLNKVIEVPLPTLEQRANLFNLYLSRLSLEESVNPVTLAQITEGKSGADIKSICNQAGLNAFKREVGNKKKQYRVSLNDLERALTEFLNQPKSANGHS